MFKDDFTTVARAHHLSLSTERAYWDCARRHIKWLNAKSTKDLKCDPTTQFREHLTALANGNGIRVEGDEGVSASTQNLFFHSLRFLYEKVLGIPLGDLSKIPRAVGHERIVDVPPDDVARKLVESVSGQNGVALRLIYGTAARLNDILRLRVKDLDFRKKLVAIQQSKGDRARLVPMPASLIPELSALVRERERIHESDIAEGFGWVHMPTALAKKYPQEERSLGWQYCFASATRSKDPVTGKIGRHHIFDVTLQRAFASAKSKLRIRRHYTIHGLRHSAAQWLERNGVERSMITKLLGHKNSSTTDRYLQSGVKSVASIPTPI